MRLPLPCLHCCKPNIEGKVAYSFVFAELEGENRFRMKCPKGHESLIGLRQPRFKILFESAALALLDGYFREAVGTIAAALERFHEYWIRAMVLSKPELTDDFEKTFKLLAAQTERQYGAFLL